ncbi:MAG: hypothetical protein GDA41_10215 [Rhodospirillales bacterium]|nr:hypothetical protein [Rhodospirillales bacterium]
MAREAAAGFEAALPQRLRFAALKDGALLELWGADEDGAWRPIRRYPVLAIKVGIRATEIPIAPPDHTARPPAAGRPKPSAPGAGALGCTRESASGHAARHLTGRGRAMKDSDIRAKLEQELADLDRIQAASA